MKGKLCQANDEGGLNMACANNRRLSLAQRYQCEFGKPPPSWWDPDSTMEELTHWENWRRERMAKDFRWWEFVLLPMEILA